MKAVFHPEAHEEMIEAARFYEGRLEGFGSDFLTAVERTTRRIEQFPEAGPIKRANIRKRLVPGFPFTVIYEIQPESISSQPLCINIASPVIGGNDCRNSCATDVFKVSKTGNLRELWL